MPSLLAHVMNGFALSVLFILLLRPLAREVSLVDSPDPRKRHSGEIPLCGGIGIFAALALAQFGFQPEHWIPLSWIVGLGGILLIGLADDRWHLPATPRLALEFIVAGVMVSAPFAAPLLIAAMTPGGSLALSGGIAVALSLVFIVGTANAVNMQDGLDGVAGMSSVFALLWLGLLAGHVGDGLIYLLAPVLAAAILGFLVFNMRHPWRGSASVFLGDAGSLTIGAVIALFILRLASGSHALSFVSMLWIVAIPVLDTLSLIVRRLAAGRNPLSPDRQHLHHLLLDAGLPHGVAAQCVAGATALCGSIAFIAAVLQIPDLALAVGLVALAVLHTGFVIVSENLRRRSSTAMLTPSLAGPKQEKFARLDLGSPSNLITKV